MCELACNADGIPPESRAGHFRLIRRLFGGEAMERKPIEGGAAFRFRVDALPELAAFIGNERRCCPFLAFRLTLTPADTLWLELTGPEGTAEFLEHELPNRDRDHV